MTHEEWIKSNFKVLAIAENAIFYEAYGELIAEINGQPMACLSVEEFFDLVEFFDDDPMEV